MSLGMGVFLVPLPGGVARSDGVWIPLQPPAVADRRGGWRSQTGRVICFKFRPIGEEGHRDGAQAQTDGGGGAVKQAPVFVLGHSPSL